MNNPLLAFLQEIISRLSSKSPKFFIIWQWVLGSLTAITGLPMIIDWVLKVFDTALPVWAVTLENHVVTLISGLMWFMSKMPIESKIVTVTSDGAILKKTDDSKLPFTVQQDIKQAENKGLVGNASLDDVINSTNK